MPSADSYAQFEMLLRENISPSVEDLTLPTDDISWNIIGTMRPDVVGGRREWDESATDYPPGYEMRYKVKVQRGGRVTGGTFSGNTLVMMGTGSHLPMGQAADAKYLDPRKTPLRGYIPIAMLLKRILGSVTINEQQVIADLAADPVEEVAADHVEDAVARYRNYFANAFYGDGTATIAQVNDLAPSAVSETAGGVSVTIDNGTYGRFMEGDLVVFGTDADPRVQKAGAISGYARVVSVDPDLRTIKIQSEPGEGDITLANNDHIMYAGSYDFAAASVEAGSRQLNGIKALVKTSGVFPGSKSPAFSSGFDVSNYPILKGWVQDTSSAMVDPAMEVLTLLLDKVLEAGEDPPTAMIAERGIWSLFSILERESNAIYQVPMGATFTASGGIAGPVLTHGEHRFQRFNSIKVDPNTIEAINPAVWMKFMPMGDRAIRWVYGTGLRAGVASIFGPGVSDGTQLTELMDAPFQGFGEFGCRRPKANVRRVGVKALRDV